MKTKKLSFSDVKGLLSRDEMKKVMGGSGGGGGCSTSPCTLTTPYNGTYSGYCGQGTLQCECLTAFGSYYPNGGTSHCVV